MIKSDKDFFLKSQQQLIVRLMKLLDWVLDCEKRVHKAETDSWYLNWKISYVEKKLKELNVPLYADDDSEIQDLMNNKKVNGKDGKRHE
tara:strand:+ start:139 stop:405 length:267 start_codon:yes stop_codon:yes gene_type:complete